MTDSDQSKIHTQKDYYYVLSVRPDATSEEIQDAYRALYAKCGPHVQTTGIDNDIRMKTFKEINIAYEVLMDPEQRKEYDSNTTQLRQSHAELRNLWAKAKGITDFGVEQPPSQTPTVEIEIEITLREAIKGCKRTFTFEDLNPCNECINVKPIHRRECPNCHGLGHVSFERSMNIDIPPGSYNGFEIRIPGHGKFNPSAGRKSDLLVKIKLQPHPFLGVLGRDITCNVPVTLYEAMLGAEIEVPTATGKVVMKIHPLTQPGRVHRLKGLGLAGADQLVTIDVVIPQHLSAEEVALYQKLKAMSKEPNPRENMFNKTV
jgi:DnaJ-class molecular chaperone